MLAATRINVSPIAIIARTPKRAIREPVMKLGAYMPMTCHWIPSAASPTVWLHITMASGADVISMFIIE